MDRIINCVIFYVFALAAIFGFWYAAGYTRFIPEPALEPDHKLQCVSYAPFDKNQSPFDFNNGLVISDKRIDDDLAILSKHFECIRTYSVSGLEAIPAYAEKYGLKVFLGAWVGVDPVLTQKELQKAVELAKRYSSSIKAVVVGNEALLRSEVTGAQLAGYIRQVKTALPEIPVTYADVWEFWLKHPEVEPVTDFLMIHILPYWEDDPVSINDAMDHIKKIREKMALKFPGKEIIIGETGWPSEGRMREAALPSRENQARFMRGFVALAEKEDWQYNLIEAFDQPWKRIKEGAVGGYWGLYDSNRADKNILSGQVSNFPNWMNLFFQSAFFPLLTLFIARSHSAMTISSWLRFSVIMTAGAIIIVMQGHQFSVISRNLWEYLWAAIVLAQSFIAYMLILYSMSSGITPKYASLGDSFNFMRRMSSPTHETLIGVLRLAVLASALIASLSLLFDARYRSFNNTGFIIPAIFFAWFSQSEKTHQKTLERLIAVLLSMTATGIFIHETPLNWQADIWVGICLLLAYPLWQESKGSKSLRPLLFYGIIMLAVYAALAVMRHGIMDSSAMAFLCSDKPDNGLCLIRYVLGKMMYNQVFGFTSLILAGFALWLNKVNLSLMAILASLCSVMFYNVSMGAIAFVLAGLSFVHKKLYG